MTLYSYILVSDSGATPNPFFGTCTLAVCKPAIRRTARVGDWIMATGSARGPTHKKLVYAMEVAEILPLERYASDPRFKNKIPDPQHKNVQRHTGDNQYHPHPDGTWRQLPGIRKPDQMATDLSGKNALIATRFHYFGMNAIALPARLSPLIHTNQGHRCQFPETLIQQFVEWMDSQPKGVQGTPTHAPMTPSDSM